MPDLFGFSKWEVLALPFAKKIRGQDPFLYKEIKINGKPIQMFWWKPNMNGHPLTILTNEERNILGRYIKSLERQY